MLATLKQQRYEDLFINWKGVMIGNGEIWYSEYCQDDSCNKVIYKVRNFHNPEFFNSEKGKMAIEDLLKNERSKLHKSLWDFIQPALQWHTKDYIIRVDKTADNKYRYAAWNIDSDQSQKPNIILYNGVLTFSGTAGGHDYEFKNGAYKYVCSVTLISSGETNLPPQALEVFKTDKSILFQPATKVLY